MPTLRPIVHAHRAGRTGFHHPDACSVASGRKNSADLCRRAHRTRRSIFAGRPPCANFICDISRAAPPPCPGVPVSTASPSLAIVLNRRPRVLFHPRTLWSANSVRGFSHFLNLFLTVVRNRWRSVPRHAPTRARTGREGRASGYYRPSRSGHLWCGHHRRGYRPTPRTARGDTPGPPRFADFDSGSVARKLPFYLVKARFLAADPLPGSQSDIPPIARPRACRSQSTLGPGACRGCRSGNPDPPPRHPSALHAPRTLPTGTTRADNRAPCHRDTTAEKLRNSLLDLLFLLGVLDDAERLQIQISLHRSGHEVYQTHPATSARHLAQLHRLFGSSPNRD